MDPNKSHVPMVAACSESSEDKSANIGVRQVKSIDLFATDCEKPNNSMELTDLRRIRSVSIDEALTEASE